MRLGRIDCMSFGQTCCSPVTALAIVRNYWKLAANVKAACKDDGGGARFKAVPVCSERGFRASGLSWMPARPLVSDHHV